jgi:putative NIF3 family GTP cyclohydrolase 1 type 2
LNLKSRYWRKNKIALWRFHDYIHRHVPDGVLEGVVRQLGWKKFQDSSRPSLFTLPALQSLGDIISKVKTTLQISTLRIVGTADDQCQRILLLPGAWGGRNQINAIRETKPDLVIVGEVSEWETSEYIRDARAVGLQRSLVVLGHAQSEEPGLEWLVSWLKENAPSLGAIHIPSNNPFTFV